MFIYDLYSICSELAVDDPNSLYKQLTKIKAPMFVAFGARDLSSRDGAERSQRPGQRHHQSVHATHERRRTPAGAQGIPASGTSFTDVPYEFARDTVDFMKTGHVDSYSPATVDVLINGTVDTGTGGAGAAKPSGPREVRSIMRANQACGHARRTGALVAIIVAASIVGTTPALAQGAAKSEITQSPAKVIVTPNSNIPDQDKNKRYYTIPNFRIGGKYDLDANPDTWRNGGEGGVTLESLGSGRCRSPTSPPARRSATTRARSSTR